MGVSLLAGLFGLFSMHLYSSDHYLPYLGGAIFAVTMAVVYWLVGMASGSMESKIEKQRKLMIEEDVDFAC